MKKIIMISLVCLITYGCGHPFCHPDRTKMQIEKDLNECDYEAEKATGSMQVGAYRGLNLGKIRVQCMKLKGYGRYAPFSKECTDYE